MKYRKPTQYLGGIVIFSVFGIGSAQAQFLPVQAKIRQTHEVIAAGKVIKTEVKEGKYFRSSDGSVLKQWLSLDGQQIWDGSLDDNKEFAYYHLDYKQHAAFRNASRPAVAVAPGDFASITKDIGTDSVENITCRIIPVDMGNAKSGGIQTNIGKSCASVQYDLILWTDVTTPGKNGRAHRLKTELYNITIGAEPDPALFSVKTNFKVYAEQPHVPSGPN
jgi:hypothetical protein